MSATAALAGVLTSLAVLGVVGALCGRACLRSRRPAPAATSTAVSTVRRRSPRLPRRRAPVPTDADVAAWCEHAARRLRSGHSVPAAIEDACTAVPLAAAPFEPVVHATRRGRSLAAALEQLDPDPGHPEGVVRAVLGACAELGGPAAGPLERTAAMLHARAAERAERVAASAQARLSARVLTWLPGATLGLLAVTEPSIRSVVASPAGVACVGGGAAVNVAGWWWMRRLVAEAV